MSEAGLTAAIGAEPDAVAPRHIYADWLDEQGRGGEAALVRAQLASETAPYDWDLWLAARELLPTGASWRERCPRLEDCGANVTLTFVGGLPAHAEVDAPLAEPAELAAALAELAEAAPTLRALRLAGRDHEPAELARLGDFRWLESLELSACDLLDSGALRELAALPALRRLAFAEGLALDAEAAEALGALPLEELAIRGSARDLDGVPALLRALPALRRLSLTQAVSVDALLSDYAIAQHVALHALPHELAERLEALVVDEFPTETELPSLRALWVRGREQELPLAQMLGRCPRLAVLGSEFTLGEHDRAAAAAIGQIPHLGVVSPLAQLAGGSTRSLEVFLPQPDGLAPLLELPELVALKVGSPRAELDADALRPLARCAALRQLRIDAWGASAGEIADGLAGSPIERLRLAAHEPVHLAEPGLLDLDRLDALAELPQLRHLRLEADGHPADDLEAALAGLRTARPELVIDAPALHPAWRCRQPLPPLFPGDTAWRALRRLR